MISLFAVVLAVSNHDMAFKHWFFTTLYITSGILIVVGSLIFVSCLKDTIKEIIIESQNSPKVTSN